MTARLVLIAAIPVAGLLLLLGGLALIADEQGHVRYEERDYVGGTLAEVPRAAAPTARRILGRQVWLVPGRNDRIWLQLADGRFRVYRLDE